VLQFAEGLDATDFIMWYHELFSHASAFLRTVP
jgi:hypothetical protein